MKGTYLLVSLLYVGNDVVIASEGNIEATELPDLINHTINKNYDIKNTEYELKSADWDRKTSLSAFFPSIEAGVNTRWNDNQVKASSGVISDDQYNSNGYSVSVNQTLLDFNDIYTYNISELDYQIDELRHHKVVNDSIVTLIDNYFTYLKFHAQKKVTEAEFTSSQLRLKQIRRNHELGNLPKTDVYEAKSQQDSNGRQLANIQRSINVSLANLRSVSQTSVFPSYDLSLSNLYMPIEDDLKNELENRLVGHNYDVLIAKQNLQRSRDIVDQSQSNFYPTVLASANYEFTDSNLNGGSDSDELIYSLHIKIPITNGGANYFNYQKSRNELSQLTMRYEQAINDSRLDFDELVYLINNNVESLSLLTSVVQSNYAVYKGMQRAYKAGSKTLTDLLSAETDLFNSIRDYYTNQYDYVINRTKLNALLGPLNIPLISVIASSMVPIERDFNMNILEKLASAEVK